MLHEREKYTNRYPLFKELIPEYKRKNTLLDFGGNRGNLLYFSDNKINHKKYTCVDVSEEAIIVGQEEFPDARFIHWDRYNEMYNHDGTNEKPPTLHSHEYIWAYSVFSHTKIDDIVDSLVWCKSLNPKKMVFSYISNDGDNASDEVLNYFYEKRMDKYGSCVDFRKNEENYFYFSDNKYDEDNSELTTGIGKSNFIAVYITNWLINKLAHHDIVVKKVISTQTPLPFMEMVC